MIEKQEVFDKVLRHLKVIDNRNGKAKCICPAHEDKEASLSVSMGKKAVVMKCHAECDINDVLAAAGLKMSDLYYEQKQSLSCFDRIAWYYSTKFKWKDDHGETHTGYGDGVKVVAEYQYINETGKYLYSKVRIEGGQIPGKLIRYYTVDRDQDKAESCKVDGAEKVLYRLPEFLKLRKHAQYVYITEGEKDCETLRKLGGGFGCCVTAGGAADWQDDFAKYFKGLNVVIFRDNDPAGEKSANKILNSLKKYAYFVKIVNPSRLDHGDVTDFLTKEGGTADSLKELCKQVDGYFASWVKTNKDGEANGIIQGILAQRFAENEQYIIVRNPLDDKDQILFYEHGVYKNANKSEIKSRIREYLPTSWQTDNLLNNACNLLYTMSDNVYETADLNSDTAYINFRNGLYEIRSRKIIPHKPELITTFQFPFDYDPENSRHPVFDRFIRDLCTKNDGSVDESQINIIQEFGGFLISNYPMRKIKKAVVLLSVLGDTGKSVLIRLFINTIGIDKVASIKLGELKADNRFILGSLPNCRLIACGDESNSNVTDSSTFKSLTGGDSVKIEPKGKQGFSYIYNGGFIIACNGLPCFTDDKGSHLFDRLLILPCEHHITEENRDADLDEKIRKEIPAIMVWFLEGLHRLIDNGFVFSKSEYSNFSKEEYRKTVDTVYRFVIENYEITGDRADRISKSDFDGCYSRWASAQDISHPVEKKNLAARLKSYGIECDMGNVGDRHHIYVYRGIKDKEPEFMPYDDGELDDIALWGE